MQDSKGSGYSSAERVDLKVDFAEKDTVKALGARWDPAKRTWYAPAGVELGPFEPWLPDGLLLWEAEDEAEEGTNEEDDRSADPQMPGVSDPWSAAAADIKARGASAAGIPLSQLLQQVKAAIAQGVPGPTWVRAETHGVRGPYGRGQYYIELAEYTGDKRDEPAASATAIIWSTGTSILQRFEKETGSPLAADMELLLLVDVDLYAPKGTISLYVRDIDPSYTLGAMARRLGEIREALQKDGAYWLNRKLPEPQEFCRVAVISPAESAGLGDFRAEADMLAAAGLCQFTYHPSPFEGDDAPGAILASIDTVLAEHATDPYDALIIIRGGGATRDLAWLNEQRMASALCHAPLPILAGIGHERDSTIIDEVACRSFDTPSKVAHHIVRTIRDNALSAADATRRITQSSRTLLSVGRERIHARRDAVDGRSRSILTNKRWTLDAVTEGVTVRARALLRAMDSASSAELRSIAAGAKDLVRSARVDLADRTAEISVGAPAITHRMAEELRRFTQIILGHSPERTLRRGFALVRDTDGRAVTSASAAARRPALELGFHDGSVEVQNPVKKTKERSHRFE